MPSHEHSALLDPPAPELVDVGGYRLSVQVRPAEDPPVLLLSGLWRDEPGDDYDVDPGGEWLPVVTQLADSCTTVLYDRGGVGRSDPVPGELRPGGPAASAQELNQLLQALGIDQPVIVAGQSIGGMVAEMFARLYPEHTAGVVLIDATVWDFAGRDRDPFYEGRDGRIFHDVQDGDPAKHPQPFPAVPTVVLTSSPGRWLSLPESYYVKYKPLTRADLDALWQRGQAEFAERLSAPQVVALDAGHAIHGDAPELVACAIRAVAVAAQGGQVVRLEEAGVDSAGGRLITRS